MQSRTIGYLAVMISGMIFGSMPLLAKIIFSQGGNSINLVFWRFFFALPLLFWMIRRSPHLNFAITRTQGKNLLAVGILGYAATAMTLYVSYNYISTGVATTLHFIYPILVIIGSTVFYRDRLTFVKTFAGILSTLGIYLLYNGELSGSLFGIFMALLSGVTYAFYVLYIDKSGLKALSSLTLTFYLSLIASVSMFFFALFTGHFTLELTLLGWGVTVFLSIFVTLGAVNLLNVGIQRIGSQSSGILSTLEPITSIVIGVLVFNELLNLPILIGCIFILSAVILIVRFDRGAVPGRASVEKPEAAPREEPRAALRKKPGTAASFYPKPESASSEAPASPATERNPEIHP